jgi:cobalt/nickel transport protein
MVKRLNLWLVLSAVVIAVAPLMMPGVTGSFKGTDDTASQFIADAIPGYQPWAAPLWQPPSSEIESLLFAVQAGLGAGILGYVIGRRQGAKTKEQSQSDASS